MSTQQIAIFGDKLVVRREELRREGRDLVLCDDTGESGQCEMCLFINSVLLSYKCINNANNYRVTNM